MPPYGSSRGYLTLKHTMNTIKIALHNVVRNALQTNFWKNSKSTPRYTKKQYKERFRTGNVIKHYPHSVVGIVFWGNALLVNITFNTSLTVRTVYLNGCYM